MTLPMASIALIGADCGKALNHQDPPSSVLTDTMPYKEPATMKPGLAAMDVRHPTPA
jgi:hypothetical protein